MDWASNRLTDSPIGIATTIDNAELAKIQNELGRDVAAKLAENILGQLTSRLFDLGVRKFVVAGGETSGEVIAALGLDKLQIAAFDYLGGGYCHAGGPNPVSLVTKAGGQGEEDFLGQAIERLHIADGSATDRI